MLRTVRFQLLHQVETAPADGVLGLAASLDETRPRTSWRRQKCGMARHQMLISTSKMGVEPETFRFPKANHGKNHLPTLSAHAEGDGRGIVGRPSLVRC